MKHPVLRTLSRKGFTLIELLTVVAIIGILAGILMPVVGIAKKKAQMIAAAGNCSSIAKAYSIYSTSGTDSKNITVAHASNMGGGVTGWAAYLAAKTKINSPDVWFIKQDSRLDNVTYPKVIVDLSDPAKPSVDGTFQAASPKSWAVVAGAKKNPQDATSYPIVWTRGLQGTTWDNQNSPWNGEGGHVAFLDGHSAWLENTTGDDEKGVFVNATTQKATSSIQEAIGADAKILEDK